MRKLKNSLIIALLFPIIALGLICAKKQHNLTHGTEVILPILGYDPRDILSGHYLTYQIDYHLPNTCSLYPNQTKAYICLNPAAFALEPIQGCWLMIKGVCNNDRFEAGIERFYIPEDRAAELNSKIRSRSAAIVISVSADGKAQVKDLLIDGQSWKKLSIVH